MSQAGTTAGADARTSRFQGRAEWLVPLVLLGVVLAVFAHTLAFEFVFDDPVLIVTNPFIQSWSNLPRFFTEHFWSGIPIAQKSYYRPFSLIWLLMNWKLFGADPAGWHADSLVLHLMNTALVYLLALRFLRAHAFAVSASAAGATLFALHPIQAEAVSWICCFNDLLACLFVLISFHAYCNARGIAVAFQPSLAKHRSVWYGVSLAGYATAVLFKEPALLFPLILLFSELCGLGRPEPTHPPGASVSETNTSAAPGPDADARVRPALILLAPYFVIGAFDLLLRRHALGVATTPQVRIISWNTELLTIPSVLRTYLVHLCWPAGLSPFYDTAYQQSIAFAGVVVPLLIVLVPALLLVWAAWRSAVACVLVCWTLIFLAPTLHLGVLPRGELFHDRYLYMPMVGLSVLAGLGIAAIVKRLAATPGSRPHFGIAGVIIGVAFAVVTFHQSSFWENNFALYSRGVAIAPHNGVAANNLGAVLLGRGEWEKAMALFQNAIENSPNLFLAHYDMGLGYYEAGRYGEAQACFKRAASLMPNDAESNLFLGMSYYHTNQLPQAMESLRKAIALKPDGVGYHFALAMMLKDSGDLAGARAEFEAELKRDPNHQPTLEQLHLLDQAGAPVPAAKR